MKKILLILLSTCLFLGACSFEKNAKASAKYVYVYKDVSNAHWAYYSIKHLKDKKYLDTFNGAFKPDSAMTRADVAKLLIKANNLNIDNTQLKDIKATDINTSDANFKYIKTAVNYNYFQDETSFRPNSSITLAELSQALVKAFNLKGSYPYAVSGATSGVYKSYISTMLANELVINNEDISFSQTKKVTRAEVATYVDKVLSKNSVYQKRRTYASKTTSIDNWDVVNGAIKFTDKKINNGYAQTKYNPLINKQMMNLMNVLLPQKLTTGLTYMPAIDSTDMSYYRISYVERLASLQSGFSYFSYVFYENSYANVDSSTPNFSKKATIKLFVSPLYQSYSKLKKGTYADDDKLKAFKDSLNTLFGKSKGQAVFNAIYPEYVKFIKSDKPLKFKMTKVVNDLKLDMYSDGDGPVIAFSKK